MDPDSTWLLPLAVACLALVAVSGLAESALGSLSRARVQLLIDQGEAAGRRLEAFTERPRAYLQVMHALRTFFTVASVVFGTAYALVRSGSGLVGLLATLAILATGLLAITSISRAMAARRPEAVVASLSGFIIAFAALLAPLVRLASGLSGVFAAVAGAGPVPKGPLASADELRTLVTVGQEERLIEEDEREMIDSIFDLEVTTVRELMVPRMDIVALPVSATVREAVDQIVSRGFSRLPVYEETIDNVVGVLYAKDLFRHILNGRIETPVAELARPPYLIPESKKVDELLRELQRRQVHIAIALDEYGGTAGLVTIEDLLEEIVGEIRDEFDREEAKIVELGEGEAIFDATVSIHDVNDTLELRLEGEDVDTVGGLLYEHLGKMPAQGDSVTVDGATLTVVSTVGRRVRKVKVTRRPPPSSDEADQEPAAS